MHGALPQRQSVRNPCGRDIWQTTVSQKSKRGTNQVSAECTLAPPKNAATRARTPSLRVVVAAVGAADGSRRVHVGGLELLDSIDPLHGADDAGLRVR